MPFRSIASCPRLDSLIRQEFEDEAGFTAAGERLASERPVTLEGFAGLVFPQRMQNDNTALRRNYLAIAQAARDGAIITPAAEWLLDNHHIVEDTFRHLRRDLVPRYYRNLPQVPVHGNAPVPAVLALAWRYVALGNSEVSAISLTEMVQGYQSARTLTIGEIWAIPAMLRLVLLENLRRVSDRVALARRERAEANLLADRILQPGKDDRSWDGDRPVTDTFAAQLLYRLRDGPDAADSGLAWLDTGLAARGTDSARIVAAEHGRQSYANLVAGNVIRSLKTIDDTNWTEWFEAVSRVDGILRRSDEFRRLDRPTRNDYRDTIERVARRAAMTETEIAEKAVALADARGVGPLLVGDRLAEFEAACGYRPRPAERLLRLWRRAGWFGIFGPALALTVTVGLAMMALVPADLAPGISWLLFLSALLSASEAAMAIVNLFAARLLPPRRLPAFDYEAGIPEQARTLVVIPSLITDFDSVDDLVEMLELHYLANPDGAVDFALLTDWADADREVTEADREVLDHARQAIEALAEKYARVGRRFYLLHRHRLWNATERVWMGWERKRGKLHELNALLLGTAETTFMTPARGRRTGCAS